MFKIPKYFFLSWLLQSIFRIYKEFRHNPAAYQVFKLENIMIVINFVRQVWITLLGSGSPN